MPPFLDAASDENVTDSARNAAAGRESLQPTRLQFETPRLPKQPPRFRRNDTSVTARHFSSAARPPHASGAMGTPRAPPCTPALSRATPKARRMRKFTDTPRAVVHPEATPRNRGPPVSSRSMWRELHQDNLAGWANYILQPRFGYDAGDVDEAAKATLRRMSRVCQGQEVAVALRKIRKDIAARRFYISNTCPLRGRENENAVRLLELLLLTYEPAWLLPCLAFVLRAPDSLDLSEMSQPPTDREIVGHMEVLLRSRLLEDPTAGKYYHMIFSKDLEPTVAVEEAFHASVLERVLMMFILMDATKSSFPENVSDDGSRERSIMFDNDPPLFRYKSKHKASKHVLSAFAREFLQDHGDVIRHLHLKGFKLTYQAPPFEKSTDGHLVVNRLDSDFRDGIRLCKLASLLIGKADILNAVRVVSDSAATMEPTQTAIQSICLDNLRLALRIFRETLEKSPNFSKDQLYDWSACVRDVARGNFDRTVNVMWRVVWIWVSLRVITNFQLVTREVDRLHREYRLLCNEARDGLSLASAQDALSRISPSETKDLDRVCKGLGSHEVLAWCTAVGLFYNKTIREWTESFRDGSMLCLLVHHYFPEQMSLEEITDVPPNDYRSGEVDVTAQNTIARKNFELFLECAAKLGGIPILHVRLDAAFATPFLDNDKPFAFGQQMQLLASYAFARFVLFKPDDNDMSVGGLPEWDPDYLSTPTSASRHRETPSGITSARERLVFSPQEQQTQVGEAAPSSIENTHQPPVLVGETGNQNDGQGGHWNIEGDDGGGFSRRAAGTILGKAVAEWWRGTHNADRDRFLKLKKAANTISTLRIGRKLAETLENWDSAALILQRRWRSRSSTRNIDANGGIRNSLSQQVLTELPDEAAVWREALACTSGIRNFLVEHQEDPAGTEGMEIESTGPAIVVQQASRALFARQATALRRQMALSRGLDDPQRVLRAGFENHQAYARLSQLRSDRELRLAGEEEAQSTQVKFGTTALASLAAQATCHVAAYAMDSTERVFQGAAASYAAHEASDAMLRAGRRDTVLAVEKVSAAGQSTGVRGDQIVRDQCLVSPRERVIDEQFDAELHLLSTVVNDIQEGVHSLRADDEQEETNSIAWQPRDVTDASNGHHQIHDAERRASSRGVLSANDESPQADGLSEQQGPYSLSPSDKYPIDDRLSDDISTDAQTPGDVPGRDTDTGDAPVNFPKGTELHGNEEDTEAPVDVQKGTELHDIDELEDAPRSSTSSEFQSGDLLALPFLSSSQASELESPGGPATRVVGSLDGTPRSVPVTGVGAGESSCWQESPESDWLSEQDDFASAGSPDDRRQSPTLERPSPDSISGGASLSSLNDVVTVGSGCLVESRMSEETEPLPVQRRLPPLSPQDVDYEEVLPCRDVASELDIQLTRNSEELTTVNGPTRQDLEEIQVRLDENVAQSMLARKKLEDALLAFHPSNVVVDMLSDVSRKHEAAKVELERKRQSFSNSVLASTIADVRKLDTLAETLFDAQREAVKSSEAANMALKSADEEFLDEAEVLDQNVWRFAAEQQKARESFETWRLTEKANVSLDRRLVGQAQVEILKALGASADKAKLEYNSCSDGMASGRRGSANSSLSASTASTARELDSKAETLLESHCKADKSAEAAGKALESAHSSFLEEANVLDQNISQFAVDQHRARDSHETWLLADQANASFNRRLIGEVRKELMKADDVSVDKAKFEYDACLGGLQNEPARFTDKTPMASPWKHESDVIRNDEAARSAMMKASEQTARSFQETYRQLDETSTLLRSLTEVDMSFDDSGDQEAESPVPIIHSLDADASSPPYPPLRTVNTDTISPVGATDFGGIADRPRGPLVSAPVGVMTSVLRHERSQTHDSDIVPSRSTVAVAQDETATPTMESPATLGQSFEAAVAHHETPLILVGNVASPVDTPEVSAGDTSLAVDISVALASDGTASARQPTLSASSDVASTDDASAGRGKRISVVSCSDMRNRTPGMARDDAANEMITRMGRHSLGMRKTDTISLAESIPFPVGVSDSSEHVETTDTMTLQDFLGIVLTRLRFCAPRCGPTCRIEDAESMEGCLAALQGVCQGNGGVDTLAGMHECIEVLVTVTQFARHDKSVFQRVVGLLARCSSDDRLQLVRVQSSHVQRLAAVRDIQEGVLTRYHKDVERLQRTRDLMIRLKLKHDSTAFDSNALQKETLPDADDLETLRNVIERFRSVTIAT